MYVFSPVYQELPEKTHKQPNQINAADKKEIVIVNKSGLKAFRDTNR